MNTKEIVAYFKAPEKAKNFSDISEELLADAEALIKTRNASLPDAKRSCYLEQDQKWRSAFKKLVEAGVDMAGYTDNNMLFLLSNHSKTKHIIQYKPKKNVYEEEREAQQKLHDNETKTIDILSSLYLKMHAQVKMMVRNDETLPEDQKLNALNIVTPRAFASEIRPALSDLKTDTDAQYFLQLLAKSIDRACLHESSLPSPASIFSNVLEMLQTYNQTIKEGMVRAVHDKLASDMFNRNIKAIRN